MLVGQPEQPRRQRNRKDKVSGKICFCWIVKGSKNCSVTSIFTEHQKLILLIRMVEEIYCLLN